MSSLFNRDDATWFGSPEYEFFLNFKINIYHLIGASDII